MTEDARRLLAWKELGGTPATVFTITFPPTVAARSKEQRIKYWNTNNCNVNHKCGRTSLDGCAYGDIFYGSSLGKQEMFVLQPSLGGEVLFDSGSV